jgi:hypothetical protein
MDVTRPAVAPRPRRVAALALVLLLPASVAAGDTHLTEGNTEGNRITGLTVDLRLRAAAIESLDLDDDSEEYVVFTFEDRVVDIQDESGFAVLGASGAHVESATSARLVRDHEDQVLVGFREDTDLRGFPVASVAMDAVRNEMGEGNPPDTVALGGARSGAGHDPGPQLEDVRIDTTLDRVWFEFDQQLHEGGEVAAAAFGLRTRSGRTSDGAVVVSVDDDEVIVDFDVSVEDAERFFARAGAVTDRQGAPSLPGTIGGDSTAPELDSVRRVEGRTQYDFRFSEDVGAVEPARFQIFADDGQRYDGDRWTRVDRRTVRVAFLGARDVRDAIVWASVEEDAVRDTGLAETGNSLAGLRIGSGGDRSGLTVGPDLTRVHPDDRTGQASFVFDEELDDDVRYDPADFYVQTEEGDLVEGRWFVEVDDDTVVITFDADVVEAASGFLITEGAVEDEAGTPSPAASLLDGGSRRSASSNASGSRAFDDDDDDRTFGADATSFRLSGRTTSEDGHGEDDGAELGAPSHEVVRGDTLWELAQRYGTTVKRLADVNDIEDPDLIHPGEVLTIR